MMAREPTQDHPLLLELASLQAALRHYQDAAHKSALHTQRQSLEIATVSSQCKSLLQTNLALQAEVELLRANPDSTPHPSTLQVSELTLALRRVSEKLDASETTLATRTSELAQTLASKSRAQHEVDAVTRLLDEERARVDAFRIEVHSAGARARAAEEERRMADLVVQEYADLVRSLEGRPTSIKGTTEMKSPRLQEEGWTNSKETLVSNGSASIRPIDSFAEGKTGLQRLLAEFHAETERLEAEVSSLHGEIRILEAKLDVESKVSEESNNELGKAIAELDRLRADDLSATKMVSRYMSFSQSSVNLLQSALQAIKVRHSSTITTFETQLSALEKKLERERAESSRLRSTLDELTKDISRESYGRRRETSLRLALLERESKIEAALSNWSRRMREQQENISNKGGEQETAVDEKLLEVEAAWESGIAEAHQISERLNGLAPQSEDNQTQETRLALALKAVEDLRGELGRETDARMDLLRKLTQRTKHALKTTKAHEIVQEADGVNDPADNGSNLEQASSEESTPSTPAPESFVEEDVIPEIEQLPASLASLDTTTSDVHDLIIRLRSTATRYDTLQRGFRDCNTSLVGLKSSVETMSPVISSSPFTHHKSDSQSSFQTESSPTKTRRLSSWFGASPVTPSPAIGDLWKAVVERLDNYCEDARVELEILCSDEARIVQGYETVLLVQTGSPHNRQEMEQFILGSLPSVAHARSMFERKLEDLAHDIAVVKKAIHEPLFTEPGDKQASGSWSGWTSTLLSPAPPLSQSVTSQPAQTFGTVVTSPTLHRVSSSSRDAQPHPLANLGLRIAMPSHLSDSSPVRGSSWTILPPPPPRTRTLSTVQVGMGPHLGERRPSSQLVNGGMLRSVSSPMLSPQLARKDTPSRLGTEVDVE